MGILTSGVALGGVPLLGGRFVTPIAAMFRGWGDGQTPPAGPPAQTAGGRARPADDDAEPTTPSRPDYAAAYDLRTTAPFPDRTRDAENPPTAGSAPSRDPWLSAVGELLDSAESAASRSRAAPAPDPQPSGGGGGGGGGGSTAPSIQAPGSQGATQAGGAGAGSAPSLPPAWATDRAASATPAASAAGQAAGAAATGADVASGGQEQSGTQPATAAEQSAMVAAFGRSQLGFEANVGQADPSVIFQSRGAGFGLWLTKDQMVFGVPRAGAVGTQGAGTDVFRATMVGANPDAEAVALDPLDARSNYFVGGEQAAQYTDVTQYGQVEYRNVYAGVDLSIHSRTAADRTFEYDFVLHPGADASAIDLKWSGLSGMRMDQQGRMVMTTGGGDVVAESPVLYQTDAAGLKHDVAGSYVMLADGDVGFRVAGGYDATRDLVVDPTLSFSSYLGGSGDDKAYGVAADASGAAYVTGTTASSNFPFVNGFSHTSSSTDGFITKLSPAGQVVYSTYLGGGGIDSATAIAVDLSGDAYVVGSALSTNFPTTAGAYQPAYVSAASDGFVTKLSATGDALLYSTFLAGSAGGASQQVNGVAVDANGRAYVVGETSATNFPTTAGAVQTSLPTGVSTSGFATELNAAGSGLVYSTYLAGGDLDLASDNSAQAVAVDQAGDAFVTGWTNSAGFPVSSGAYRGSLSGSQDAFLLELNPGATTLVYSTYFGGSGSETGYGIAVDRAGRAYVVGSTTSTNLPTTSGARQTSSGGGTDAFAATFTPTGTLSYSTYLGGSGTDSAYAVAVDVSGYATVAGGTASTNFPTYGAFQSSNGGGMMGGTDAFVARLTPTGTLAYSTYLGGSSTDQAQAVALDLTGAAYVVGLTNSTNFPTAGGFQATNAGGYDAFVSKILSAPSAPVLTSISSDTGASSTDRITTSQNLHVSGTSDAGVTVTLERAGVGVIGSVLSSVGGTWTYDYTGTTLAEGTYDFTARATGASGLQSAYSSPEFLVSVDRTAPTVSLVVPSSTATRAPVVRVLAQDQFGVAEGTTVTLDVDLNNNGNFTDSGEAGYATGVLHNGNVDITLPALPGNGTYRVQARVSDLAGNQGTSAASTFVLGTSTGTWVGSSTVLTADPLVGDWANQLGDVTQSQSLDVDQSPGTPQSGNLALVYHSSQVSQHPIVQITLPSDSTTSLPATISARLTFDGTAAATVTYSTTGFAPGDVFTMALQSSQAITATGAYGYSVLVHVPGQTDQTLTGTDYVVAQDSSPYGAGWSLAGIDRLVAVTGGELRVYGSGGYRFYAGSTTFTSPAGDNGTLALSGGVFTYTTPDSHVTSFDSSGYETGWKRDGMALLTYAYDGSHRLSTVQSIDGATGTFTYNVGNVTVQAVGSRTTTLTLSSGDLTKITNPDGGGLTFTYDGNARLTRYQTASTEDNYAYTAAGALGTMTWGATVVNGVTNPSRWVESAASTAGLSALVAGTAYGTSTDPSAGVTRSSLDGVGRTLATITPQGALTQNAYTGGYLTSQTDPLGRATTYTLDGAGYVTKTLYADGTSMTYAYQSAFHALTTMTDAKGNSTVTAYDMYGHPTTVTDALSFVTSYTYAPNCQPQSVTDPFGNTTSFGYDADFRPTSTTNALGQTTTVGYDTSGNVQTTTDALNHTTTMVSDPMGRTTATIDALGGHATTTYSTSGLVLTTTDPLGTGTSQVYDAFLRGVGATSIDGTGSAVQVSSLAVTDALGRTSATRDAAGAWTTVAYSPDGETTSTTDALGNTTASYYDLAGQLLASRDAMGAWTKYGYDLRGRQVTTTDALGEVTTTAYDAAGNTASTTDPLGRTTTYSYDALNRQIGTLDPLGRVTTTTFDAAGRVATSSDAKGFVTSYAYNALGRATTTTAAVGTAAQATTKETFDAVGNAKSSQDANGNWTTMSYDALNRQTATQDSLGNRTTATYDAVGSVLTSTDALNKTMTMAYDALHRQVAVTDALSLTTTTILDARGQAAATIDPLSHVPITAIDPLGRSTGAVDANGVYTQTVLDANGSARLVADADGNQWTYVTDALGRTVVAIDPTGARTTTAYDAAGDVSQVTDRDGRTIQYSYDAANRETGEVWKSNSGVTVNVVTYAYDANDDLTGGADSSGAVTYTYDQQDRGQSYTNVFGQVLTYGYDANGNQTLRQDSLGGVLTSVYDASDRLTSRQFGGAGQTAVRVDFGYDARDEQTSRTWYTNLAGTSVLATSVYAFDDSRRLTSITNKNSSGVTLSYYDYGYDGASRVQSQTHWSQVGTVVYSGTNTYTYDATSQLLSDGTATYAYDVIGNRDTTGYATGAANRMTSDGTFSYTYDAEGNTLTKSKGTGLETWYYTWDNRNRLTSIRETTNGTTNELTVTYTYDVEDNLVQQDKWLTGGATATTRYAYDGANVWADLDGSNNVQVRYVFGDGMDQILTRSVSSGANAGLCAYTTDNLGSVRDVVNSSGSVQDHVDYSGFGMVTESTASVGDRTKFQGRWDDLDTGTANYRGRQEFIADGRFMSQDPTGLGPDINPYRFVGNDATNETDPSGYFPDLDTIKVTNKGKTADLSKFGDGKINVKDGPQGVLSVQTGVGLDRKSPGGTAFQKETNWIRIAYKPTNTVTIAKMDFVQFVWFELKQTKCGNETNIGMPITGVNKTGEFTTNAGPAFVSANTAAPIWVVDRADGAKSISYINTYLAGSRDGELVMYDGPGPGQVAKIAKLAAMLSGTAADVTQWKAIAHFDTYLVYNQKPIYKLSWTATSSVGPKTDATPNVYDIVGGKPVTSLDPAQVALLKEAKYKGQTDISL